MTSALQGMVSEASRYAAMASDAEDVTTRSDRGHWLALYLACLADALGAESAPRSRSG